MTEYTIGLGTALWLGILTSMSPCPLATNIAAVSFIGKRVDSPAKVFAAGVLYTLGRTLTYLCLGALLLAGLLGIPSVSQFLQLYMNKILGPVLIVAGMFLLELIAINMPGLGMTENLQKKVERNGIWGAGLLGILFALTFCPVSAALFFGSLIPLAVKLHSSMLVPLLYGVGTALPVLLFAVLLAFGVHKVANAFNRIKKFELWARTATGCVFIGVGVYYSLKYIFGVL
jgi:cytochrome c biogenesis protein CcdA